jgi:hypothetical protein
VEILVNGSSVTQPPDVTRVHYPCHRHRSSIDAHAADWFTVHRTAYLSVGIDAEAQTMIEMNQDDYVLGMWFCPSVAEDMDWLGIAYRRDDRFVLDYRFRYYDPTSVDPFDGKDTKSWFTIRFDEGTDEDEVFRAVNVVLEELRRSGLFRGVDSTIVLGTWDDLITSASGRGYLHFQDAADGNHSRIEK